MVKDYQPYSLDRADRETESVKPVDKAHLGWGSNLSGRSESEHRCSPVNDKYDGRACYEWAKTVSLFGKVVTYEQGHHRGSSDDMIGKRRRETRETLPRQLSLFGDDLKPNPIRHSPKWTRDEKPDPQAGAPLVHSSNNQRDNITHCSKGTALQVMPPPKGRTSIVP